MLKVRQFVDLGFFLEAGPMQISHHNSIENMYAEDTYIFINKN